MKTKYLSVLILITLFSLSAYSQTETSNDIVKSSYNFSLGAGVGYTTAYGISFRYTPCKFGIQTNFAPSINKSNSRINVGLTFLYNLIEAEHTTLYLYQGNSLEYYKYKSGYYLDPMYYYQRDYTRFNNGIGVGIQFTLLQRIGIDIMGGYAFYENFTRLGITGEAGLYYKF